MRSLLAAAGLALVLAAPAHAVGPSLFFLDAQHGWASGQGGLLGTSDGGHSWQVLRRANGTLASLQFLDALHGFALVGSALVGTDDGGRSWHPVRRGVIAFQYPWALTGFQKLARLGQTVAPSAAPSNLCVAGPGVVWTTSAGRLFVTRNGGRSWRKAYTVNVTPIGPDWRFWKGTVACTGGDVWALFTDGAAMSHQAYVVEHSVDGGRTWAQPLAQSWFKRGRVIDAYAGPFAVTGRSAFFVGFCDPCDARGRVTLTATQDDGRTFRQSVVAPLAGRQVGGLAFPDAQHGFVAIASNSRGVVLATIDGGRTWRMSVDSTLLR